MGESRPPAQVAWMVLHNAEKSSYRYLEEYKIMEGNLLVYTNIFSAKKDEILTIIDKYLTELVKAIPRVSLAPEVQNKEGKQIWKGTLLEIKKWGKEDIDYGYIEIIPVYENSDAPLIVNLYCSHPRYLTYWGGLSQTLLRKLAISDGSPDPKISPWNLIPDKSYHRKLLELWHKNYSAPEISQRINVAPRTIYDTLRQLRKKHGTTIVPYKLAAYRQKKQ